mmetsp:Transcript_15797/g.22476  ORF Transcript_15797/g.22476 Transcript_15797/m.22476 type:complete len:214 (-) Transcript_15797:70-711(-)
MLSESTMASTSSTASVATSSTQSSRKVLQRDRNEVRLRLLNNLGIFNDPASINNNAPDPAVERKIKILRGMGLGGVAIGSQRLLSQPGVEINGVRSKLSANVTVEPLKYKDDVEALSSKNKFSHDTKKKDKKERRRINFSDSVSVVPIPMRSEYSDRVRSRLWSNRYEIHENATRNAIEFAAEGWDWRHVTEDEGMFVCTTSGELIHPVHCHQ